MSGAILSRRQTALHEAGHAVAYHRLGLDCTWADIRPDGTSLGHVWGVGAAQVLDKTLAEPVVLACCAGAAAVVAAGYKAKHAIAGASLDFDEAEKLIEFWGLPDNLEVWMRRAVELMRRPENVVAVGVVSDRLLKRKWLERDCIAALVEFADSEGTEADFARFLQMGGYF